MDVPDEATLDVDLLGDDGSEEDAEAPPSTDFYAGPGSTPTSCASSPRGEEPASPHGSLSQPPFFHHQPYTRPFFTSGRRGPGRPRKEGVKLAKEGKIVRRYRGGLAGSVRGAKRNRISREDSLDDAMEEGDDFTMPAPDDPPYMPEKWPGKVCALCNLSERSQLGQGEMRQYLCNIEGDGSSTPAAGGGTPTPTSAPATPLPPGLASPPPEIDPNQLAVVPLSRRQKAFNKCKTPLYNMEHTDELSIIGHQEVIEIPAVVSSGAFYVHRCCLDFTPPFQDQVAQTSTSEEDREQLEESRVRGIVIAALSRKCTFCQRHGASIPCKMSCSKYFHFPCVLASGGFLDFMTKSSFCKDHLYQVPLICNADIECRTCHTIGDIPNLMTCIGCGAHYHGTCVGLAQLPGVRAGWCCRVCRACQVCRNAPPPADPRAVACELCDKLYHAACLRPPINTVPKYGWKCKCCRVCSDCGARSPGAGPSSRWHAHYTVCDSCYQQRNKGSCCPLCRRAYRAAAYRAMIRCRECKRYVHGMCDPEADPQTYRARKEQNPGYSYTCPICKAQLQVTGSKTEPSFEDSDTMASTSQDSSFGDDNSQQEQDPLAIEPKQPDVGLGKGKPFSVSSKVAKKKISGYKLKGGYPHGKIGFKKRQRSALEFGRKRGSKPKMRGVFGVPGLGLQRPQAPDTKTADDDPGVENKLVLCSSKDKFVLTQDLCVMCGAIGTDAEGILIACAQCGQSYHPYCVNIKVSAVIVTLGWRCLDCTVCEGCGQRSDDARLILCDDCDTAWHTYCCSPALPAVPPGAWRCARCRQCRACGARSTPHWTANYTECGPCASLVMCCICSEPYSDGELIIQCFGCSRWLHAACDSIRTENDAQICCKAEYKCQHCRGRDVPPPHVARALEPAPAPPRVPRPSLHSLGLAGEYYVDDVCLSQRGAHHMKQLEAEMGVTHTRRKRRFKHDADNNPGAAEQEPEDKPEQPEVKEEPGLSNIKEGMLWTVSTDGPPPEGFAMHTTETGVTVLRRKRQRNLNKLGIGGFVVRQRQTQALRAQQDEDKEMDMLGESPSNKRKPRRKPRSKLMEQFPPYMQEAFFGKELTDRMPTPVTPGNPSESPNTLRPQTPEGYRELRDFKLDFDNSDSDGEDIMAAVTVFNPALTIQLNQDEIDLLKTLKPKDDKDNLTNPDGTPKIKSENDDGNLKHTEDSTALKNAILGPQSGEQETPVSETANSTKTEPMSEAGSTCESTSLSSKDELSLLNVNLDAMVRDTLPDMDTNDVDEIFKGVFTDDSQESQESSVSYVNSMAGTPYSQQRQQLHSPMDTYPSPYHNEYPTSTQSALSPMLSENNSWGSQPPPASYNQRSADKMRADESLGSAATISAVLYANTNHPEWKTEFPNWVDRCKQILKKWRALPAEQKAPYLQRARDNRSAIRMKKAQQPGACQPSSAGTTGSEEPPAPPVTSPAAPAPPAAAVTSSPPVRAPNVTVTAGGLLEADAHIRVLTPSEIMRTLPRLPTEQERSCGQQRSAREAEQERQWKQLQQQRQQQTQQQQQIIHDQRIQAMQRIRAPDGSEITGPPTPMAAEAPRSVFPAQRFPLHYANTDDINRQLRDLLQRHPEKMWSQQAGDDGNIQGLNMDGQPFRQPLPVGMRPRMPLQPGQRPEHLIIQQRLMSSEGQIHQNIQNSAAQQQQQKMVQNSNMVQNMGPSAGNEPKQEQNQDHGTDEMDMGDMDKLEQDTGNIGEVGDILTGLGGEDDEELLESLTAEIGEQFNILEYADPELAALNDTEHILDGLDLADDDKPKRDEMDQKPETKPDLDHLNKSGLDKVEIKTEMEIKSENTQEIKPSPQMQLFAEGVQRIVSQQGHQLMQQQAMASRQVQFNQAGQQIITQQVVQRPQVHFTGQQLQHFAQQGGNAASIANAMAQVRAALANRGPLVRRLLPTQQGGAPGSPQPGLAPGATARAPPPPPYPGTLRPPQPPPPPYPQTCVEAAAWPEWLHRRPLLLQEQPLLLEELLEQEKREQEREGGEWGAGGALPAPAAAAGGVPLYARAPPPAPPPPPDPPLCDADHRARLLYEAWLKQYNAFAADQLRYYEAEVQKLRKIRKSLNSKQRQLRKAGNELLPNDAAELQRVSTEQQALQKHLEAARKQARQHTMLIQEYESKHRPPNPQVAQQTVIAQQQLGSGQTVYTTGGVGGGLQAAGGLRAGMALGLGGGGARVGLVAGLGGGARLLPGGRTLVIEQAGARAAAPQFARAQPPRPAMSPQSPIHHLPSPQHQPAMSPIHQHSPMHHQHSPMHQPMQSPLQSPLHVQQTSMHVQQSPMTSQQSPMHVQQSPMSQQQQSPMHVQQSPMSQQQSPMHVQQSVMTSQQSPMHVQQSVMTSQQSPMHVQQSPMSQQQSPMHVQQQSPMHVQQSPMSQQQSPMHVQQSPMSQQQSPMHVQQSPMSQQQSPMQSMSPQHFLQQLQAQRTSPQLPQPSRSPQIYQQTQIQSPVSSHSPQLQNLMFTSQSDYSTGRFSRPAPGCSPLPTRFARPPHHQQGMRVGVPFGGRQQTSPLGSPQPLPSPGNPANELARQQMLQRQQYSPMGGAPSSPSLSRSPHVARTPTPSASPAASPAPHQDHGGGGHHGHHMAPVPLPPPGYRYYKPGLFGGAPVWPNKDDNRRQPHISKVSILKRKTPPRPRFGGKTAAPGTSDDRSDDTDSGEKKYVLYSTDMEYTQEDVANLTYDKDDDDDDIEEFVEHLDDDDIVVVEPGAISPQERIATEEDFEELIDSGKPEDEVEEETQVQEKTAMRTETTTKTVAVISLATKQSSSNVQQYKLMNTSQCGSVSRIPLLSATVLSPHANTKILNDVSQATVASVSIANQTISVPVLKSLSQVSMSGHTGGKTQIKKMPLNLTNQPLNITMSAPPLSKPISSVISVISSNVPKGSTLNPVITLATSNTSAGTSRVPVSILTQHQVKHKIVKTIEKPMGLSSLSNSKLSSLSVSHDATLPAKIFQDDAASPDSTVTAEGHSEKEHLATTSGQHILSLTSQSGPLDQHPPPIIKDSKDIDIETEISQQTELPHSLCITDRTPLLLGKADIKSPDPIPEKIPDNIMEGDDDDKPEDNMQSNLLLSYNKPLVDPRPPNPPPPEKSEENVMKTLKAIANQTKEMVIDSNMQITSDVTQESVQISIPSPTPSQERYLNDITMQEHVEPPEGNPKHVESFEDMLCMLENISDDAKAFNLKQAQNNVNQSQSSNAGTPTKPENKEVQEQQQQFVKKEPERLQLQSATVPQLSPLSQPAELTSNMANVSQQLRTIMSSLNTSKVESQTVSSVMRRNSDATTPTQVNFENLLPSSKVEVPAPRPSPVQRMDISSLPGPENIPMNASQMIGSRVNSLSGMGQMRKSPGVSPINSPVSMQNQLMKSPAQSPLLTSQSQFSQPEDIITASAPQQQIIQMPGLTKIFTSSTPTSLMHSNAITTSVSSFQKGQVLPTSILGHTLLQPTRQISTGNLQYNPQCISSSQPPALVMTSRPLIGNKDAPPNVTVRTHSLVSPGLTQMQGKPQTGSINFITSSKLLHTQLTSPLKRSKSTDEPKSDIIVGHIQPAKRHSVESVIVKSEPMETDDPNAMSASDISNKNLQQAAAANQRNDESQNVLLKQLLQTSTTAATAVPQRTMTIQRTAPALGTIPSLEAQLARPSIPPASTLAALSQEVEIPKSSPRHISSVGSPFGARPVQTCVATSSMSPLMQTSTTQSLMDVRKPQPKVVKEETTPMPESSPTPKPMMQQTYPMTIDNQQLQQPIKKEIAPPQQSPIHRPFTPMDVKKELLDESSQQSATSGVSTASDQGNTNMPMKEEYPEGVNLDPNSENNTPETPSEAKKRKRREYQQKKRKQMQMSIKAAAENSMTAANAKKRPRKGSRYEEDYDTFIDNLMTQLRLLPPMQIQEPSLTTNFSVCPLFGSGDLTKLKNKDNDIFKGDLLGEFGNARIPNVADYYNTKPFGDEEPLPEKPPASTQRGFYDQEFQPIQFDDDPEDKKLDFICKERDTDTPDTIVSCSSPECLEIDPPNRFPGLKLTDDEDEDQDSDSAVSGRASPIIPIIAPVPIRIKPLSLYHIKDEDDGCKSLRSYDRDSPTKSKMLDSPSSTESNENVTVTLTLTSGAAEDILGVLKELAGILHIPPPTSYQIVERTATPPSHKLGLYRSKGKDGKEGTPIDIQSILNGAAKFCRHCDVVILDSVVRAKASEFPLLSANKGKAGEILCDSDSDLYFCSTQCYERFAWRPTNIILDGKSSIKEDSKSDVETNLSKDRDDFDTASTESMETDDLDIKPDIKDEKMDLSFIDSLDNDELMKEVGDDVSALDEELKSETSEERGANEFRGVRYKAWAPGCIVPAGKFKRASDRELRELVFRVGVSIRPVGGEDARRCELCGLQGDGPADGVARLLNCDVDRWVHLNCALWSDSVYETVSGALMNLEAALAAGCGAACQVCRRLGATVRCFKVRCGSVYHLGCAVKDNCVFYKNKSAFCASHAPKNEKDNELTTLSVQRRVYVSRDEQRQVASVMLHSDTNHLIRVGGLIFLSPGHLLPHQLPAFHTPNYIYPVGYKIVRFYWSMRSAMQRARYVCWVSEVDGRPRFHVRAQADAQEWAAPTPRAAWAPVLDAVAALREERNEEGVLKLWSNFITGEDLFGFTEPAIVRVLESLPGIETLTDYRFKFGRSALLEGGLAVNPSGCARCEPRGRCWRRPARSLVPAGAALPAASAEPACPYSKQFVHTKSSQYKKMKLEWRNNVYLARSKIQGLGLYAARDLEKNTMVIEYIGEIIRSELSEIREKQYESKNRGIYMFRLDERRVVDATLCGGLARYINHSCQPNCVAELVEVDRHLRIIIMSKRRIARGEELAYDYKFDIEDDAHKIMCMCGAPNCKKWMN